MTPEEIRKQMMGSAGQTTPSDFNQVAEKIISEAIRLVGCCGPIIINEEAANETALFISDLATIEPDGSTNRLKLNKGAAVISLQASSAEDLASKINCLKKVLQAAISKSAGQLETS